MEPVSFSITDTTGLTSESIRDPTVQIHFNVILVYGYLKLIINIYAPFFVRHQSYASTPPQLPYLFTATTVEKSQSPSYHYALTQISRSTCVSWAPKIYLSLYV